MKRLKFIFLIIALISVVTCDQIDENRLREGTTPKPPQKNFLRKVLVEQFVGHKAKKSPSTEKLVRELVQKHGDTVVAVAIHAGELAAVGGSFLADYRTEEGTEMYKYFEVQDIPVAMIDRKEGGKLFEDKKIAGEVRKDIDATVTRVKINIVPGYEESKSQLNASVTVTFLDKVNDEHIVSVFLTEDKLVSTQLNDNQDIGEAFMNGYEHNNVLRGTMNRTWGEVFQMPIEENKAYTFSYKNYKIPKEWDIKNMSIIAFVTNKITKEVLQVEKIAANAVIKPTPDPNPNPNPNPTPKKATRKILIEEFTGHDCTNCPSAHQLIQKFHDFYRDTIISVTIHAGYFSRITNDLPTDFTTSEGTILHDTFGVSNVPVAMINRMDNGSLLMKATWESEIKKQIRQKAKAHIKIIPTFDQTTAKVTAKVEVTFLEDVTAKYNLCVLATESDIVSPQKNNNEEVGATPIISDYHHKHILRGTLNGAWGVLVAETPEKNKTYTFSYDTFFVRGDWKATNMAIVAYVYNQDTKEVIQAEEVQLID